MARFTPWQIRHVPPTAYQETSVLEKGLHEGAKFQNYQLGHTYARSMQKTTDFRPRVAPSAYFLLFVQVPNLTGDPAGPSEPRTAEHERAMRYIETAADPTYNPLLRKFQPLVPGASFEAFMCLLLHPILRILDVQQFLHFMKKLFHEEKGAMCERNSKLGPPDCYLCLLALMSSRRRWSLIVSSLATLSPL
eukprot:1138503-Pelagomonas_calceolata.AAC.8